MTAPLPSLLLTNCQMDLHYNSRLGAPSGGPHTQHNKCEPIFSIQTSILPMPHVIKRVLTTGTLNNGRVKVIFFVPQKHLPVIIEAAGPDFRIN